MRRTELTESLKKFRNLISSSEILDVLNKITGYPEINTSVENDYKSEILSSFEALSKGYGKLNSKDKIIASKIGFEEITDFKYFEPLIVKDDIDVITVQRKKSRIENFLDFASSILEILDTGARKLGKEKISMGIIIPYSEEKGVKAEKVRNIIRSIEDMYNAFLYLEEEKEDTDLRIASADSGSELLIIFVGTVVAISAVGNLILEVLDRYQHRESRELAVKIDSVIASITAIEKLNEDRIGEERAERIKSAITKSIRELLGAGVVPEEAEEDHGDSAEELAPATLRLLLEEPDDEDQAPDG